MNGNEAEQRATELLDSFDVELASPPIPVERIAVKSGIQMCDQLQSGVNRDFCSETRARYNRHKFPQFTETSDIYYSP